MTEVYYFGALARQDRMTSVPRDVTEGFAAMEASAAAMADNPALALAQFVARIRDQVILRERGFIRNAEYAVRAYGQCLGEDLAEGSFLVSDPSRPIRSGQIATIRTRGDIMTRGKVFLGRADEITDSEEIFTEKPDGVYVFWQTRPAMMIAIAGQDLLAADLVVARLDIQTKTRADLPTDIFTEDDQTRLDSHLAVLDRSPLVMRGESVFEIEQGRLRSLAKAQTSSPGQTASTGSGWPWRGR